MGKPSYDDATLAAYFHPSSPELFDDPVAGPALRWLAAEDPDILAAVADVGRSLIRSSLEQAPFERLRRADAHWRGLAGFRRVK